MSETEIVVILKKKIMSKRVKENAKWLKDQCHCLPSNVKSKDLEEGQILHRLDLIVVKYKKEFIKCI